MTSQNIEALGSVVFEALIPHFYGHDGYEKYKQLNMLPFFPNISTEDKNKGFNFLYSKKLFDATKTNDDFSEDTMFKNISLTPEGKEKIFADSEESPWYTRRNFEFYIPYVQSLIAPKATPEDWLELKKWYEVASFKNNFRLTEDHAKEILNKEEKHVYNGIIYRLGDRLIRREQRGHHGVYESYLKLTPHYKMLTTRNLSKPFEVARKFYDTLSRTSSSIRQFTYEKEFILNIQEKFKKHPIYPEEPPDYFVEKDFYHECLAIVELIEVETDEEGITKYRINHHVDSEDFETWQKQHEEWWFSIKYFKPAPPSTAQDILHDFDDEFSGPVVHKPEQKKPNETRQRKPAGSPFGFNERDWEWVETEWGKTEFLKIVFGYQWNSPTYKTEELYKNVKESFDKAVNLFNQRNNQKQINYEFKPLTAGYGGHLFNEIARDIISADIAVFDTSDLNPNVMIEMGVALTWGVLVLPIKDENKSKPPSDVSGQTWVDYRSSAEEFKDDNHHEKIANMIEKAMAIKIANARLD